MIFVECQQGTPEWFAARAGVITASKFSDAVSTLKNGDPSQASKDYAYRVAVERIYGETTEDTYQTFEMRRGQELEPLARMAYELKTGGLAEESGVVLTDDRIFGYSTDGLVGDDGLIEIKCPNSARKLVEMWETGDLSEYEHQIQGGMWITGRKWCDFIMYAPQLEPVGKHLYIKRVERDDDFIEAMESKLWEFARRVQSHVDNLKKEAA
ncbi:lambda exonuclease family protein [Neopusillimonas maritima]|uniref:Exonuclease n=1 Tax=Neopusillimonas maritima TaxID=2026239 RepID=A0A3A1YXU5_9BURK|nr:lambda exonuclease family protein [Neopusillimonas maritima]RIY41988.1 exonuclease [Neopusillimonas maritima]